MTSTANRFCHYGRSVHLRIENAGDLQKAAQLDEAHWAALNAPISTIDCDKELLEIIDADNNGRITCHELRDAINWLLDVITDHAAIEAGLETLKIDSINLQSEQGSKISVAARKILNRQNLSNESTLTLKQVRSVKKTVESMPVSEAGVILADASEDEQISAFISEAIQVTGGSPHPTGQNGLSMNLLNSFLNDAKLYLEWKNRANQPKSNSEPVILPFGSDTCSLYAFYEKIRSKLDQYFSQCELLGFDPNFSERIGFTQAELEGLDFDDPLVIEQVMSSAPLAKARAEGQFLFNGKINPYYVPAVEEFRKNVAERILNKPLEGLSSLEWLEIKAFFEPYRNWLENKPGGKIENVSPERLGEYLKPEYRIAVEKLIQASHETAYVLDNIRLVEKAILYQAGILDLANNFVSFPHLYDPQSHAMFEMGTLVMDGRRFNLAVHVDNRAGHSAVAKTSNMFVMYVEAVAKNINRTLQLAVPVTSGGVGNICKGKRGVFYDRNQVEYDAAVVDIIENPISFREAVSAPFKRIGKLLSGKIESITTDAEKKLDSQTTTALNQVGSQPVQQKSSSGPGILMGAGVAIAALGSSAAYITKTLHSSTALLKLLGGVAGAILFVIAATAVVAMLKLRRRDLSAILEGSGWGINARMRLSFAQSRYFTQRPRYPKGSIGLHRHLVKTILWITGLIILLAAIAFGIQKIIRYRENINASNPAMSHVGKTNDIEAYDKPGIKNENEAEQTKSDATD